MPGQFSKTTGEYRMRDGSLTRCGSRAGRQDGVEQPKGRAECGTSNHIVPSATGCRNACHCRSPRCQWNGCGILRVPHRAGSARSAASVRPTGVQSRCRAMAQDERARAGSPGGKLGALARGAMFAGRPSCPKVGAVIRKVWPAIAADRRWPRFPRRRAFPRRLPGLSDMPCCAWRGPHPRGPPPPTLYSAYSTRFFFFFLSSFFFFFRAFFEFSPETAASASKSEAEPMRSSRPRAVLEPSSG